MNASSLFPDNYMKEPDSCQQTELYYLFNKYILSTDIKSDLLNTLSLFLRLSYKNIDIIQNISIFIFGKWNISLQKYLL